METVFLKIRRQDDPEGLPYWEEFAVEVDDDATLLDAITLIRQNPRTSSGNPATPIVIDCSCASGACGACAVVIDSRARLACEARLKEYGRRITVEPLQKFPVIKDLVVDRSKMEGLLKDASCWVETDQLMGDGDVHHTTQKECEGFMKFSDCVMCGACIEACPQANERSKFFGAFLFARVVALGGHYLGANSAGARLDFIMQKGGVADCAQAGNCAIVCPRGLPLTEAAARCSSQAAVHSIKRFFRG